MIAAGGAVEEKSDVLIAGAGVGGLTLGLLLGEKGYRVTVVDQRRAIEPLHKPELLQPAGLQVLQWLDVLGALQEREVFRCEVFSFFQVRGRRLCRMDYRTLRHPFPFVLIAFPRVTQSVLLEKLSGCPRVRVRWGCILSELVREPGRPIQAVFQENGRWKRLSASVVVGADGRDSLVREASGIHAGRTDYRDAFVSLVVRRPPCFGDEVRYYMGRRQILGMFPVSPGRLCLLFMVPTNKLNEVKARGLAALKAEISSVSEDVADMLTDVTGWDHVSFMTCRAVRAASWVEDGVALMGDAAHACHPHVAQGSTQAMLDAMALAQALDQCLDEGDCSAKRLLAYEHARRPSVEALRRVAHEYAWLWNTGNPLLAWVRDRAFREIGRRPALLSKVMETEAGLRVAPLSVSERLQAAGVLP